MYVSRAVSEEGARCIGALVLKWTILGVYSVSTASHYLFSVTLHIRVIRQGVSHMLLTLSSLLFGTARDISETNNRFPETSQTRPWQLRQNQGRVTLPVSDKPMPMPMSLSMC